MAELLARPSELRADAARNRARLIEVARRHHAETGSLPLNAIAAEAGVGIGTAYRHFPDPQVLVEALAIDAFDDMLAAVRAAISDEAPAEALRQMVTTAYQHLCDDGALAQLLSTGSFTCTDAAAIAGDLYADVAALIERAQAVGALRADVTVDDLRRLLCGLQAAATSGPTATDTPMRYAEILLDGLRPR